MKYSVVMATLIVGALLAFSPMMFAQDGVHADRIFHAQWAGFVVILCSIVMGLKAIDSKGKQSEQ